MCESTVVERLIVPPATATEIVTRAETLYLKECVCRARIQACPRDEWDVCLFFEYASAEDLQGAKPISTGEALAVLETTAKRDSVYQLFYRPESQHPTEICSCCTCCCTPLHRMKENANYSQEPRSQYVAVTDEDRCIGCEACIESCFFEARALVDDEMQLVDERCFGCGRCIPFCPEDAISLELQPERGMPIPELRFHQR